MEVQVILNCSGSFALPGCQDGLLNVPTCRLAMRRASKKVDTISLTKYVLHVLTICFCCPGLEIVAIPYHEHCYLTDTSLVLKLLSLHLTLCSYLALYTVMTTVLQRLVVRIAFFFQPPFCSIQVLPDQDLSAYEETNPLPSCWACRVGNCPRIHS